jgi:hypothetical protein
MFRLKLAFRKIYLQHLQVNYVAKKSNNERTKEQKEFYSYLWTHPQRLFSTETGLLKNKYSKELNMLQVRSEDDELYKLTKKRFQNA